MKTLFSAAFVIAILATAGCSSSGGSGGNGNSRGGSIARNESTQNADYTGIPLPGSTAIPSNQNQANTTARTNDTTARMQSQSNTTARNNRNANNNARNATPASTTARTKNIPGGPKNPDVSQLKLTGADVPSEVRAIERVIDRRSAILADNVKIEVSKNYEWDVSLSGDSVTPQRPDRGGTSSEAVGNPRAYFRNLDIRARDKITIWRSGLGVAPFIRVYANGAVSYIDTDDATGKPRVKRSGICKINNASLAFEDDMLGIPTAEQLGAKPTAQPGN